MNFHTHVVTHPVPVHTASPALIECVRALAGEAAQIEIAVGLLHTRIEKLDRQPPIDIAEAGLALREAACDLRELLLLWLGAVS